MSVLSGEAVRKVVFSLILSNYDAVIVYSPRLYLRGSRRAQNGSLPAAVDETSNVEICVSVLSDYLIVVVDRDWGRSRCALRIDGGKSTIRVDERMRDVVGIEGSSRDNVGVILYR